MGLFTKLVVVVIISWFLYSFYSISNIITIPKPQLNEIELKNGIENGDVFDLHIYVSSGLDFNVNKLKFLNDPKIPNRIIPSIKSQLCMPNSKQTTFHVLSFTTIYQNKRLGFSDYLFPLPSKLESILNCQYLSSQNLPEIHFSEQQKDSLTFILPSQLRKSKQLYLYVIGTRQLDDNESAESMTLNDIVLFFPVVERLTTVLTPEAFKQPKRFLLQYPSNQHQLQALVQNSKTTIGGPINSTNILQKLRNSKLTSVPHEVTLGLVVVQDKLSKSAIETLGLTHAVVADYSSHVYYPPISVNSLTSPREEFIPLIGRSLINITRGEITNYDNNDDTIPISLTIKYKPIGMRAWLLQNLMVRSLEQLESKMSISSYDIDSLKIMMGGGNPLLVISTFVISTLHILFSFLTVSSDLTYWKENSEAAAAGISPSSLIMEIILALFIALYLNDVGQSKLALLAVSCRILLYLWKLYKIWRFKKDILYKSEKLGIELPFKSKTGQKNEVNTDTNVHLLEPADDNIRQRHKGSSEMGVLESSKNHKNPEFQKQNLSTPSLVNWNEIVQFEKKWMTRLLILVFPAVIGVALYQLIYVPQVGWKSWLIHSLALCSYAGGFVAMTPQLFRNYKLQSVDHLPWATLSYQALNAFVDDFFAFIVRMPQMHRVSVFRDDIVFIIYVIQRWVYRNNKKRVEIKLD